jgi:Zn-dependent peptidase ImmA (M78 family)
MNSFTKGALFEQRVFDAMEVELAAGRLCVSAASAELVWHPRYYSKDRGSDITFDLAIECRRPSSKEMFLRLIFECKDTGRPVQVDDVEEFDGKVRQVAGVNVKAVMVSRSSFQKGALQVARSKGIALVRYFEHLEWELERSTIPSRDVRRVPVEEISRALTDDSYRSQRTPFYCSHGGALFACVGDLVHDVMLTDLNDSALRAEVLASSPTASARVPFVKEAILEERANEALEAIQYSSGPVSLLDVCRWQTSERGLTLRLKTVPDDTEQALLGRITFEPLEIITFARPDEIEERHTFTLAHELGHLLLGHEAYVRRECCADVDLSVGETADPQSDDILRLDWQANSFASKLLLPRSAFVASFERQREELNLLNRGHGALFLDDQPINRVNYFRVVNVLRQLYGVSREVVKRRLLDLHLLTDASSGPRRLRTFSN